MLDQIGAILFEQGLVSSTWLGEVQMRGELVKLFRDYYAGDHRLKLTSEMRKMMQISNDRLDRYNANYCEMVVSAMADRLEVDGIEAVSEFEGADDPAQVWVDDLLAANRFDGLQIDVREAVLRDGETFVMAQYDDVAERVIYAHELAWDGECGVLVIKDRQERNVVAGVKVWFEGDYRRANIYYPDRIARYNEQMVPIKDGVTGAESEELRVVPMGDPEDTSRGDAVPGVPIIQFVNKSKRGTSELVNVIPLQDSLNSTLISAVMNALLTAFSLLFARGFKPPPGITPGMMIHAMIEGENGGAFFTDNKDAAEAAAALMETYSLERIQPGEVEPLIKQCEFVIKQIGVISFTPVPGLMGGDSQSGEALQERRVGQTGKVKAAQVRLGNRWEDALALGHRLQDLFGVTKPPVVTGWNCRWKSAEIRNDTDIRETAKLLHEWGYQREALRLLSQSTMVHYDEADITALMAEKAADTERALAGAGGNLPGLEMFGL